MSKVKINSIHKIHWMGHFFLWSLCNFERTSFWERLCETILVMGQWFRISNFVLVLVASYTVQQSISVCSILVYREF